MWLTELSHFVASSAEMFNILKDLENQKPSRSSPSSGGMDIVSPSNKAQLWLAYLRDWH